MEEERNRLQMIRRIRILDITPGLWRLSDSGQLPIRKGKKVGRTLRHLLATTVALWTM